MSEKSGFKDHFSGHAGAYASARPGYPRELFEWLAGQVDEAGLAWDCATGNGQAARSLAVFFDRVVATDASDAQIASAAPAGRVEFRVATAESSGLDSASADLVTVAQALHWFDIAAFFAEAERVLRPGGLLAYWCYGDCVIDAACDGIVRDMYARVDDWWPPERDFIRDAYAAIESPFPDLASPSFSMETAWTADEFFAYASTWSACQRATRDLGCNPLAPFRPLLRSAWGEGRRTVTWPLTLRVGRKPVSRGA